MFKDQLVVFSKGLLQDVTLYPNRNILQNMMILQNTVYKVQSVQVQ